MCAFAWFLFLATKSIQRYLQYHTVSQIRVLKSDSHVFPLITVCNLSPLQQDRVRNTSYAQACNASATEAFDSPPRSLNQLTDKQLKEYGQPLRSLVVNCSVQGRGCEYSDWTAVVPNAIESGVCYTLNTSRFGVAWGVGAEYGIEVLLDVQQAQYCRWVQEAGALVIVYESELFPNTNLGLTFSPALSWQVCTLCVCVCVCYYMTSMHNIMLYCVALQLSHPRSAGRCCAVMCCCVYVCMLRYPHTHTHAHTHTLTLC